MPHVDPRPSVFSVADPPLNSILINISMSINICFAALLFNTGRKLAVDDTVHGI